MANEVADHLGRALYAADDEQALQHLWHARTLSEFTGGRFVEAALRREVRGRPDLFEAPPDRSPHDPMAYDSDGGTPTNTLYED